MKRIYHHFSKWEDYKSGFYSSSFNDTENHIALCIDILTNQKIFEDTALKMIDNWRYSIEHNLTDNTINRIAYIGQSSCCFANGTPSFVTKLAWGYLSENERNEANNTAKKILSDWIKKRKSKDSLWD